VFNDVIATEKSRPHQLTSKKNVESSSVWHPDRVSYDVHHEQRQGGRRRQIKAGRESDSMFNPQPNVQRRTFVVDAKKNKESASILNTLPQDNYRHETGGRFKTSLRNQETASMFNSRPQPAQPRAVQKGSKNKSHLFTNADTYKPPQPALKVSQKNFESASMFNGKQPATARGRGRAIQGNLSNRESSDMFQYQQQQPHSARGSNNNNNGGYVSDYNGGRKHLSQRHKDNQVIISPGPGSYADRLDSFRQGFKDFTKVPMKGGVRNNRNQSSFNIVSDGREQYRSQRYYNQPYTARY
jgi:hypothetical protein